MIKKEFHLLCAPNLILEYWCLIQDNRMLKQDYNNKIKGHAITIQLIEGAPSLVLD